MYSKWSQFDSLMMPLVITDRKGTILYKNDLSRQMNIARVGSNVTAGMDYLSKTQFKALESKAALLQLVSSPYVYRCVAIPFFAEKQWSVGLLFPSALLGGGYNDDNEQQILKLAPALRRMLTEVTELPYTLGRSVGKKSANIRLASLLRKVMDVYLNNRTQSEETKAVVVDYFLSVLTYFFRQVFKYQGVQLAVSQTAAESEFVFLDHRNLVAMLLSMIELIIDRSGTDRMYIDIYGEAGQAVIMFSALLHAEWAMPDDSLPDSYILFSLLRRHGIDYEFYNTVSEDSPRMVCRLFLPLRMARPTLQVRCGNVFDNQLAVLDFLSYLEG